MWDLGKFHGRNPLLVKAGDSKPTHLQKQLGGKGKKKVPPDISQN